MTYTGSQINKQTLETTLQQEITNATNKANNSWQKGVFNNTDITNVGLSNVSRVFYISEWKAPVSNIEQVSIVIPVVDFMGTVKVSVTGSYMNTNGSGAFECETSYLKVGSTVHKQDRTVYKADIGLTNEYYFLNFNYSESVFTIPIVRKPNALNRLSVKVELLGIFNSFNMLKDATLVYEDFGTSWHSYPWTPQVPTVLLANTYNQTNLITNVGVNRATRAFQQINWKGAQNTPELWESILIMNKPVWGILELDIAGYSASSGGAKIVVELGISVPNDASSPSVDFRNVMKVVSASQGFTDNFYVRVEHRPSVRYLIIQVFKRIYNDPVSVVATFTSTVSPQAAFETLKGFSDGINYTNGISIPTELQKDFDTRIKENFTLFSSFKQKIASATTDKGVPTSADATSDQMANNIRAIPSGVKYANFEVPVPTIAPNGTITITTPAMNFQPRNSTSTLIGAYIYQGHSGDLSGAPYIQVTFATKYTINNLGNGNYTVSITIKNPMSINGGNQNHGFTFTGQ